MKFSSFQHLRRYTYKGGSAGISRYLNMVNRKQGVIRDPVVASVLQTIGYSWETDQPVQSQYDPQGLYDALRKYDRKHAFQPNRKVLEKAYNIVRSTFAKLEGTLEPYHELEVVEELKLQASAGAPYFTKKSDVLASGWEYDKEKVGKDPCVAYYRTQSRLGSDGWKAKVRLVWGYPMDTTVAEGRYARPIIAALMESKTPYVLGLSPMAIGASLNAVQWCPFVGSFDWSGFDSSIPPQLISIAFKMVRTWFKPGTIDEAEWNKFVKYFIFTPILMPDGKVYFGKTGGIPSGSFFTGIIGSLVNLLCIHYLTLSQGVQLYSDNVLVMGDDSVVGLKHELDLPALCKCAFTDFGMVLHPEKQRYTRHATDVDFLSHSWSNGRQSRDKEVTLAKLVYSERSWKPIKNFTVDQMRMTKVISAMRDNPSCYRELWVIMESLGESRFIDPFTRVFYTTKEATSGNFSNFDTVKGGFLSVLAYGR